MKFNARAKSIPLSVTLALDARAKELIADGRDVINMTAGEPDFDAPAAVRDAARSFVDSGKVRYTPAPGRQSLRETIADHLSRTRGVPFEAKEVTVCHSAKHALLGVPESLIAEHGAVSEPVARAMAHGVRERFGANIGIATTGISGPGGGSDEKPVGLVYLAMVWGSGREGSTWEGSAVERFVFPVDRVRHRELTAQVALDWTRRLLLGIELASPSLLSSGGSSMPGSPMDSESAKTFTPRIGSVDPGRAQEPSGGN
jgi:PncC family amidohydrolase